MLFPVLSELGALLVWVGRSGTVLRGTGDCSSSLWVGALSDYGWFLAKYSRGTLQVSALLSLCSFLFSGCLGVLES